MASATSSSSASNATSSVAPISLKQQDAIQPDQTFGRNNMTSNLKQNSSSACVAASSAHNARDSHDDNIAEASSSNTNCNPENNQQSALEGTTCMELALEGERLCKTGDFKNGIRFFEEALNVGTSDDRTLSAIYSQLGNAYFYMEDYQTALDFHKRDVNLVNRVGDEAAEAKACGNLGNTYKMLGKYDEAAIYCRRYLEISRKLSDKVGEARALYNLGNVYHTQGKRLIGVGGGGSGLAGASGGSGSESELIEPSNNVKFSLERAIDYYELNLKLVKELQDFASMGRAYGNLGNTHYLLGNFDLAVRSHSARLELAKQTNDKSAERRACLNLGNANVFQGNYPEAIENYSAALKLAQELRDKYTEAHSCYVLANTYTFLRDYKSAISHHLRYLEMIKDLDDKLGEGRACSSLVNLYQMIDEPELALVYAKKHHDLAKQLDDKPGMLSAQLNIEELEMVISQRQAAQSIGNSNSSATASAIQNHGQQQYQSGQQQAGQPVRGAFRLTLDKRQELEQRRFKKQLNSNLADVDGLAARRRGIANDRLGTTRSNSNERLFDMIAHFQSGRIDDQRCEISAPLFSSQQTPRSIKSSSSQHQASTIKSKARTDCNKENRATSLGPRSSSQESACEQKQPAGTSSGSQTRPTNPLSAAASAIKASYRKASLVNYPTSVALPVQSSLRRPSKVSTDHQEKLFELIAGAQRQRMDEQRASLPSLTLANGIPKVSNETVGLPYVATSTKLKPSSGQVSRRLFGSVSTSRDVTPGGIQAKSFDRPPDVISQRREKSNSVVAVQGPTKSSSSSKSSANSETKQPVNNLRKEFKLARHFQTFDVDSKVQDDKFLDCLMRYQSTRFNDQRSEFPKPTSASCSSSSSRLEKVQSNLTESTNVSSGSGGTSDNKDDFLDLIVRFQSDRIENQRSAPPTNKGKN